MQMGCKYLGECHKNKTPGNERPAEDMGHLATRGGRTGTAQTCKPLKMGHLPQAHRRPRVLPPRPSLPEADPRDFTAIKWKHGVWQQRNSLRLKPEAETGSSSHLTVKDERKVVELHFIITHLVRRRCHFGSQPSINWHHGRTRLGYICTFYFSPVETETHGKSLKPSYSIR